jgi:hypothetical protein
VSYKVNPISGKLDYYEASHAVGASIASTISDGDTTHSPDGNSVFDALALKAAKTQANFLVNQVFS